MTEEEKYKFTLEILKNEAPIYARSPKYKGDDMHVERWLDTIISKSNYEARIKGDLDSAYNAALKIYEQNKEEPNQVLDFSKYCSVIFFLADNKRRVFVMNYERPQYLDDIQLNKEAENNAKDMIKRNLNGAKELIAIGIARSEMQRQEIINEAKERFK
ncbi:hypothetical protein [Oceanobacillus oncorhynchi]|uniref:hypothetical protein n=1 Tax=Oceanobacillus oncorhynchi TaxID=545501 RepID=UPI002F964A82